MLLIIHNDCLNFSKAIHIFNYDLILFLNDINKSCKGIKIFLNGIIFTILSVFHLPPLLHHFIPIASILKS